MVGSLISNFGSNSFSVEGFLALYFSQAWHELFCNAVDEDHTEVEPTAYQVGVDAASHKCSSTIPDCLRNAVSLQQCDSAAYAV